MLRVMILIGVLFQNCSSSESESISHLQKFASNLSEKLVNIENFQKTIVAQSDSKKWFQMEDEKKQVRKAIALLEARERTIINSKDLHDKDMLKNFGEGKWVDGLSTSERKEIEELLRSHPEWSAPAGSEIITKMEPKVLSQKLKPVKKEKPVKASKNQPLLIHPVIPPPITFSETQMRNSFSNMPIRPTFESNKLISTLKPPVTPLRTPLIQPAQRPFTPIATKGLNPTIRPVIPPLNLAPVSPQLSIHPPLSALPRSFNSPLNLSFQTQQTSIAPSAVQRVNSVSSFQPMKPNVQSAISYPARSVSNVVQVRPGVPASSFGTPSATFTQNRSFAVNANLPRPNLSQQVQLPNLRPPSYPQNGYRVNPSPVFQSNFNSFGNRVRQLENLDTSKRVQISLVLLQDDYESQRDSNLLKAHALAVHQLGFKPLELTEIFDELIESESNLESLEKLRNLKEIQSSILSRAKLTRKTVHPQRELRLDENETASVCQNRESLLSYDLVHLCENHLSAADLFRLKLEREVRRIQLDSGSDGTNLLPTVHSLVIQKTRKNSQPNRKPVGPKPKSFTKIYKEISDQKVQALSENLIEASHKLWSRKSEVFNSHLRANLEATISNQILRNEAHSSHLLSLLNLSPIEEEFLEKDENFKERAFIRQKVVDKLSRTIEAPTTLSEFLSVVFSELISPKQSSEMLLPTIRSESSPSFRNYEGYSTNKIIDLGAIDPEEQSEENSDSFIEEVSPSISTSISTSSLSHLSSADYQFVSHLLEIRASHSQLKQESESLLRNSVRKALELSMAPSHFSFEERVLNRVRLNQMISDDPVKIRQHEFVRSLIASPNFKENIDLLRSLIA